MMPDVDKVMSGLECCKSDACDTVNTECPYNKCKPEMCMETLCSDALELLKAYKEIKARHDVIVEACEVMMKELRRRDTVGYALDTLVRSGWKEDRMHDDLIVRCKDCKHSFQHWNNYYRCDHPSGNGNHNGDWFCADGERR